ncbi:hypothetical protein M409DRAFT_52707 [Zasmidium cellare ATCC 36951]|uniref:Uncharacterized protein n=1 Tax=Zasmidium cellare ATCC 36951 TaxID=1080233 RepID=A0A6A6CUH7_ZASCE|nr:uncharacterized protein M409DRAFT_52707 [Zasmidium cellare ATCC 36951]KAF2169472.1 hypothetical protein M409DRAFT_52707 [Zasmidium cellare ATCC 36951]
MPAAFQHGRRYWKVLSLAHLSSAVLVTLIVAFDLFGPSGRYWHHTASCGTTGYAASTPALPKEYVEDEERYLPSRHPTNLATHMVKFDSKTEWEAWDSATTDTWRSMLPSYPLGQDDDFNDGIPYGLGMLHQIHCLLSIRESYSSFLYTNDTTDLGGDAAKDLAHISHCFNWIRQVGGSQPFALRS